MEVIRSAAIHFHGQAEDLDGQAEDLGELLAGDGQAEDLDGQAEDLGELLDTTEA